MLAVAYARTTLMAVVIGLFLIVLAACGGDDSNDGAGPTEATSAPVESTEKTVTIGDKAYTCAEITGIYPDECGPEGQAVFAEYGENIDGFVNSGRLGPLFNEASYEAAAYAGIIACVFLARGEDENAYVEFMLEQPDFQGTERINFLPPWFEAQQSLCPSEEIGDDVID